MPLGEREKKKKKKKKKGWKKTSKNIYVMIMWSNLHVQIDTCLSNLFQVMAWFYVHILCKYVATQHMWLVNKEFWFNRFGQVPAESKTSV